MSTNPFYDGNNEGVVAHLTNTMRLVLRENGFSESLGEKLSDAVSQRWHLTPAQDVIDGTMSTAAAHADNVADMRSRIDDLLEENARFSEAIEVFKQLDYTNSTSMLIIDTIEGLEQQLETLNGEGKGLVSRLQELGVA